MIVTDDNKHLMLEHLVAEKLFSLDTETTGLDWSDRAFAVVISTGKKVFYMEHWNFLKHIFHLPLEVIMINAKYDMRMIGLPFYSPWIIRDIGIFERILRNNGISLASYSLDAIAKRRLGKSKLDEVENYIKAYELYEERETKYTKEVYKNKRFDQVDRTLLMQYAMNDATLTYDVYQDQLKSADEEDMRVFNNECALLHCTYKMEMEGIKIDEEYTEKALHWEADRLTDAKNKFREFSGFKYENKKKILIPFFEKHGEHINLTAKGNPRLTDDDLEGFKSPAAKLVQEIRYHEKRISTYFTSYLDLADSNSFIHPNIIQHGTATGRFSYAKPNCFGMDTEVLTKRGWLAGYLVRMDDYIACYKNGKLEWNYPEAIYISPSQRHEFIETKNQHIKLKTTLNHRLLFRNRKNKKLIIANADNFRKDSQILHGAALEEGNYLISDELIRLSCAIQADGHYTKGKQTIFVFHKERKYKRLLEILLGAGIEYTEKIKGKKYIVCINIQDTELLSSKKFNWKCLTLSKNKREVLLEELRHWDGNSTRKNFDYCSNDRENIDVVQSIAATLGYRCHVYMHSNKKAFIASITKKDFSATANIEIKKYSKKEKVWCVKVPSGFILVRRNGDTYIVGNCQNIPKDEPDENPYTVRGCFVPSSKQNVFLSFDYDQQEYRLMLDYANEAKVIREVLGGKDLHQSIADMAKTTRKNAKTLSFGILYGSGPQKVSEMLGISVSEARKLRDNYLLALPKVDKFISDVIGVNRKRGFVKNWLGRKLRNNYDFSYKAPNHLIQGGCGDVIKVAMVRIHNLLKDTNIKMRLQVHDQLVFEGEKEELMHNYAEIRNIMQEAYTPMNGTVLTVSASYSEESFAERTMKKWT